MGFTNLHPAPTETPVSDKDGRMAAVWVGWYQVFVEQLQSGAFTLPDSEIQRIVKIVQGTATPPSPTPTPVPGIGCGTTTQLYNAGSDDWVWGTTIRLFTDPSFGPGTTQLFTFTTLSGNHLGSCSFYEFGWGGPFVGTAWISASSCGNPVDSAYIINDVYPRVRFWTGTNNPNLPGNAYFSHLNENTKYWVMLQPNASYSVGDVTALEMSMS